MSLQLTPPVRIFAIAAAVIGIALVLLMLTRSGVVGSSDDSSSSATSTTPATATPRPAAASKPTPKPQPTIHLIAGLPSPLARALRKEKVVVVSLSSGGAIDRQARAEARAGAKQVGAGFISTNLLREKQARAMQTLAGMTATPGVLVVIRPGKVVKSFTGFKDQTVVAQAARNAGAR